MHLWFATELRVQMQISACRVQVNSCIGSTLWIISRGKLLCSFARAHSYRKRVGLAVWGQFSVVFPKPVVFRRDAIRAERVAPSVPANGMFIRKDSLWSRYDNELKVVTVEKNALSILFFSSKLIIPQLIHCNWITQFWSIYEVSYQLKINRK